jgi:type III pantothenate kinase
MVLLIDAGNTRIKWAIVDPQNKSQPGLWEQDGSLTHDEFAQRPVPWSARRIERAIISNVAGGELQEKLRFALQGISIEWFTAGPGLAGVTNRYQNPQQLGSDRFATAIAVHALFPDRDIIVATCGTATTIDAVTAQGDFIGGMIAPGLLLMAQSLAQNTAQLPAVRSATQIAAHFADRTHTAILSGCLAAQAGAIEYAVQHYASLTGSPVQQTPLCVLSGGAAEYIAPSLKVKHELVENLVLIGLHTLC